MDFESKVHDLLSQWEQEGQKPSPEELCAQNPDLLPQVQEAIARLRRVNGVLAVASPSETDERQAAITIPGYELLRELGQGGQGVVYLARRISIDRLYAIKVLRNGALATETQLNRFEREARILGALKHPGIVSAFDFGKTDQRAFFLVMDFVEGQSLDDYSKSNKLHESREGLREALRIFVRICEAVGTAHVKGIIHRDLKPSNIRIDNSGTPHILDFGLARTAFDAMPTATDAALTLSGQFLGTLPWSSPEQATGNWSEIDTRTDVYSLGVILYQLVTGGQFPYSVTGSLFEIIQNIRSAEPTPPSQVLRKALIHKRRLKLSLNSAPHRIEPELEAIVLMALAKNKEKRYHSAHDLGQDLKRYLNRERPVAVGKLKRARHKTRALALLVLVAFAADVGFNLYTLYLIDTPPPPYIHVRSPLTDPDPRLAIEALDPSFKNAGAVLPDLIPVDGKSADQMQQTFADLNHEMDQQVRAPARTALPWTWETKDKITQTLQTSDLKGRIRDFPNRVFLASRKSLRAWIEAKRRRDTVIDAANDERALALNRVWCSYRDEKLNTVDSRITEIPVEPYDTAKTIEATANSCSSALSEAKTVDSELVHFAARVTEVYGNLPEKPRRDPSSENSRRALIASRVDSAWAALLDNVCKALATNLDEAVKLMQTQATTYAQRVKSMESAAEICDEIDRRVPQTIPKLDSDGWTALEQAARTAAHFGENQDTKDLIDPSMAIHLVEIHQLNGIPLLVAEAAKPSANLEIVLECIRQIQETGRAWPASMEDLTAALGMRAHCLRLLTEGVTDLTIRNAVNKELDLIFQTQLTQCASKVPLKEVAAFAVEHASAIPDAAALGWLRYDMELYRQKQIASKLPADDAGLERRRQALVSESRELGADWPDTVNAMLQAHAPGPKDNYGFLFRPMVGTSTKGFDFLPDHGQLLQFVHVKATSNTVGFYLSTTEVPLSVFSQIVEKANAVAWMPAPPAKKWLSIWKRDDSGKIVPSQEGIPSNEFFPSPDVTTDAMFRYPITYVPPAAAIEFAALLGCRLPSPDEWQAALSETRSVLDPSTLRTFPRPRLRESAWSRQISTKTQTGPLLEEHIFMPQGLVANPSHNVANIWDAKTVQQFGLIMNGTPSGDESVLFRRIDYAVNDQIKDLIGNVAEWVVDTKARPPLKSEAVAIQAWVQSNIQKISVIGGSALSPPDLDPTRPYPVTDANGNVGYADVGFRLVFDDKDVSLRERYAWMLNQLEYQPPGTSLTH